jgi:hypothetical protein
MRETPDTKSDGTTASMLDNESVANPSPSKSSLLQLPFRRARGRIGPVNREYLVLDPLRFAASESLQPI